MNYKKQTIVVETVENGYIPHYTGPTAQPTKEDPLGQRYAGNRTMIFASR